MPRKGFVSKRFVSFEDAKREVQSHGIQNPEEYRAYCKSIGPRGHLPFQPDWVYRGRGWAGWADFLGVAAIKGGGVRHTNWKFLPYPEARTLARGLGFTSEEDYVARVHDLCPK